MLDFEKVGMRQEGTERARTDPHPILPDPYQTFTESAIRMTGSLPNLYLTADRWDYRQLG